ncbi:MAG TPA: SDR family NAD(P)-dependent oxidoreductase [Gemmatimonadales bacterium]|jgi:NAD(P)-dependent dehydrogenase (short-subunit alcohol dehydrogenase family)
MRTLLNGKVAIVTGGGTGIGEAICREFSREGAKLVVNGLPDDPVQDVVDAIAKEGAEAIAFAGDVSEEENAQACIAAAVHTYGRLDILVNNAGVLLVNAETDKMPVDKFDEQIRCNVRSAFLMTKYALTPAKGPVGAMAGQEAKTPPRGTLDLQHTHEGTRHKDVVKIG